MLYLLRFGISVILCNFIFSNIFFSEYAEGSSNNKYLEIFNASSESIDLSDYSLSSCANGCNDGINWDYPDNVIFESGIIIAPGDVYVVCHGSADDIIQAECDQNFTYLSNGDDVFAITQVSDGTIIDIIGTIGDDPGTGWEVAGVTDGTKDHTMVRKSTVQSGNYGDWSLSAGTSSEDSEWVLFEQNTWDYLGSHSSDSSGEIYGCMDVNACNYNPNATVDNNSCWYSDDLYDCNGDCLADIDECGICGGDGGPCEGVAIFFSEYGEGSSNHKFLEIYNGTGQVVDLSGYAFPNATNGANTAGEYDYWNEFDSGATINPGDVYVICHGSSDDQIQSECDQNHTYLSNGDDGFCLVEGSESSYEILDCIGTWDAEDPGNGWDVAGVTDATKDHTLVRKENIQVGNNGNWESSAGTDANNSEWIVLEQDTWSYVGSHPHDFSNIPGCTDPSADNYNPGATFDDGSCQYLDTITIQEIQGSGDASLYVDQIVQTTGIVTGVTQYGFFFQNGEGPRSGLWAFGNNSGIQIGDLVTATGTIVEYYDMTEIEVDDLIIESSNNMLPNPYLISTGSFNEDYEAVLVKVEAAQCVELPSQYGEWYVNDGSGNGMIGDNITPYEPILNQQYNIQGPLDYTYSNFKIQATEISLYYEEGQNIPPTAIAGEDIYVDEGQAVTLDGSGSYDTDGSILGYLWIQESGIPVFFGDYESPVISFTAPNESTSIVFSLQVIDNEGSESFLDHVTVTVGSLGIYDIQYAEEQTGLDSYDCYPSTLQGQSLNVSGIVTSVKSFSSSPNFYIQDPSEEAWGGVYVYVGDSDALNVGDEVEFLAEVVEYYGVTELSNVQNLQVLSSNNVINPVSINTGNLGLSCGDGEAYEGMFVEFTNVTVESINTEYNSIYINDGSGTTKIDDYFFNFDDGFWPEYNVGDTIESVRGTVHYYFSEYVIYPRSGLDFTSEDIEIEYLPISIEDLQSFDDVGDGDDCFPSSFDGQYVDVT